MQFRSGDVCTCILSVYLRYSVASALFPMGEHSRASNTLLHRAS